MKTHSGDHDSQVFAFGTEHAEVGKYSFGWNNRATSHGQIIAKKEFESNLRIT